MRRYLGNTKPVLGLVARARWYGGYEEGVNWGWVWITFQSERVSPPCPSSLCFSMRISETWRTFSIVSLVVRIESKPSIK